MLNYVDQILLPKIDHAKGVDHGATAKVLVDAGECKLVWRGGSTFWSGLHGNRYCPASLAVVTASRLEKTISEGGRLSRAMLDDSAAMIDAYFGDGVASVINLKMTLVITSKAVKNDSDGITGL